MAMLGCLLFLVVLVSHFTFSRPCTWRTCRHQWRNDWSANPPQGYCSDQIRRAHFIYTTHRKPAFCPRPSGCSHAQQRKRTCNCRQVYHCPFHNWSGWSGHVGNGQCSRQSRSRNYNEHVRYTLRPNNCGGIKYNCGATQHEYRNFCSCRYAVCTLGWWSNWRDLSRPVSHDHCVSQVRYRSYSTRWAYIRRRDNCHGIQPSFCPGIQQQTRERVVRCPPLQNLPVGKWKPDDCSFNSQVCTSYCRLQCDVRNGYEISGFEARKCQANGQWTTPWNSYCKDVQAPNITCPSPRLVGNDLGKKTANITLPNVTATDNDGKVPSVTHDAGGAVREFEIKDTSYIVTYTATDEAGNNASCYWHFKVKDTERPTAVTCPDDIKIETKQNEIRVNWETPTFVDNYDKPPLRIKSNKNSGVSFHWGKHKIIYTAFDRANNNATCEFFVDVGPVKCPLFDPPQHGSRACNKKAQSTNGPIRQEIFCNVQCKKGYAFVKSAPQLYWCKENGIWHKMVDGVHVPLGNIENKPWPDCAPEESVSAAMKEFTIYTGTCIGDEAETLDEIRKNFLDAIKSIGLAEYILCEQSQGLHCVFTNIRVYCGSKSKRDEGSLTDVQGVVTFDFVVNNTHPSADRKRSAEKLQKMIKELGDLETHMKKKLPSLYNTTSIAVEAKQATVFCPGAKVKRILDGAGSEIERSICVECPIGTHYNNNTQSCDPCQVGSYQDTTGRKTCKPCPAGKLSIEQGATNVTQCYDKCKPGEHAHATAGGAVTCLACPIGSYQPIALAKSCIKCPLGKTTTRVGASALEDCK